jgi:hypothetical protein
MTIDAALSRVRQPRRAPLFGNCWANPMSAAAANAKLVPNEELESLNAKMHVSRGGQLTPYGDPHGVLAETKAGLDQVVRERAICFGSRRVGWMAAPTTFGIKRSINASANAPTRGGSGKAVRRARRTSTGFERAPLRRADASSRRLIRFSVGKLIV